MECKCSIETLMLEGCQCGQIQREKSDLVAEFTKLKVVPYPVVPVTEEPNVSEVAKIAPDYVLPEMVINPNPVFIYCLDPMVMAEAMKEDIAQSSPQPKPKYPNFNWGMEYEEITRGPNGEMVVHDQDGKLIVDHAMPEKKGGWENGPIKQESKHIPINASTPNIDAVLETCRRFGLDYGDPGLLGGLDPSLVEKFPQVKVDPDLIGHTSNPEFEKLACNATMEALRDRTIKVDVPFLKEWDEVIRKQDEETAKTIAAYSTGIKNKELDDDDKKLLASVTQDSDTFLKGWLGEDKMKSAISGIKWRSFKDDPPHDYRTGTGMEDDPDCCWFVYRHTHRPESMSSGPFLSYAPCYYENGVFRGYESHMRDSKYPTDQIEILYWCMADDVQKQIMADYKRFAAK